MVHLPLARGSAALSLLLLCAAACETKPPEVFEIPAGYRGWVEIRAKRPECPPLRREGRTTVFTIPAGGVLCTSSPIAFGRGREEFYYGSGAARERLADSPGDAHPMIWQVETFGDDGVGPRHEQERDRIRFFVGTENEYKALSHGSHR